MTDAVPWAGDIDPGVAGWLERFAEQATEPAAARAWAEAIDAAIVAGIPQIAADPLLLEDLHASTQGHWEAFMSEVSKTGFEEITPGPAVDFALAVARRGHDLEVLLKVYRIGQEGVWDYAAGALRDAAAADPDSPDPTELLVTFWTRANHWVNRSVEALVKVYDEERARVRQGAMAHRIEIVDAVLAGHLTDARRLSKELQHPFSPCQTAFVLWTGEPDSVSHLERMAVRFADALGASQPLVVRQGSRDLWCWVATRRPPEAGRARAVEGLLQDGDICAAVGGSVDGVEGFRISHGEALAAQRLALASPQPPRVMHYTDVEMVVLMSSDQAAAERYVARVLGDLAGSDKGMDRLRQTLHAVLTSPADLEEVAAAMNVHKNTLRYRMKQAEDILGFRVNDRRADVEMALRYLSDRGRL